MKIIAVLLALLMGVSLVACAAPAEFDEQTLKDGSVACVTAMQSGDFDAVIKKLSPATAAQLSISDSNDTVFKLEFSQH
ncbi:MAG: hypothetical protein RR716_05880 [Christensenellaceae bacterium]